MLVESRVILSPFGEVYSSKVSTSSSTAPPLLCIPPVGVGISNKFFDPMHREWAALGGPADLHSPDLLGCGNSQPKRRIFYTPQSWAEQLLDYIRAHCQQPVILVTQGGLLPVALEIWKAGGKDAVAGVCFVSPPPVRFFAPGAEAEPGVRPRFSGGSTSFAANSPSFL